MRAEILAPAGGEQAAYAALYAGADAIYLGMDRFSARANAENFAMQNFSEVVHTAHLLGAKVYVALNTLVKDSELEDFFVSAREVWNAGADAILLQDLFLGRELHRRYPGVVLHLSTQAGCCNAMGAKLAKEFGFSRVVIARETPMSEIGRITPVIETEVFVQGALCASFSGQCYLSSFIGNNSGNRGRCKQPCRKKYRIDRKGFEEYAFALSPADLSLGGRMQELLAAGVTSLKIEGRMRRPEYVAAAVKYYRAILDGENAGEAFTRLVRAYNRGDYCEGLAFGQKKNFLSRAVQGHIGEMIGSISFRHVTPFCAAKYSAERGDAFKILRGGREVGGAVFAGKGEGGFFLSSGEQLKIGDEVRLTTSVSSNAEAMRPVKTRPIRLKLRFLTGEKPFAACEGVECEGETPLEAATTRPLFAEEIAACFQRTDGLPFEVSCEVETDGIFLPKSALNAFRRQFFSRLSDTLDPKRTPLPMITDEIHITPERGTMSAVIGEKSADADIFIYKPSDYANISRPKHRGEVYLYLPPLFTSADEEKLSDKFALFDGIYTDGYYGIALAKKYRLPLFAGTGFNLTNAYAVAGVREYAKYFALSKELDLRGQNALAARGAFVLSGGDIKVMDICFCPFGADCASCDRKKLYRLTDEEGRVFPLRRYRLSDMVCRFELYNCAALFPFETAASKLFDNSALPLRTDLLTKGHAERSLL